MSSQVRTTVLAFFRKPGARVAISRTTLSRVLNLAFPTLDVALASLEIDGFLERHPIRELEQWRPVRGFEFPPPTIPSHGLRAEARQERLAAGAKAAEERAERYRARLAEREESARRREAAKAVKELRREEEKRLVAEALARRALALADEETVRRIAALKPEPTPVRPPKPPKITLPEFDSTYRPTVPEPKIVERVAELDPWAKIRARANARPKFIPSSLREPTAYEKMTGRIKPRMSA